jgi:hypothetical protein
VGVQPSYFSGDYGTGQTTKIWYLPAYVQYRQSDFRLKLTFPYIRVDSSGAVVSGGTVIAAGGGPRVTHSGMGDAWLEARYTIHGQDHGPDLVPYGKIKFGTASRADGLGTGENDYEAGLGLEWTFHDTFPFARAGYRIVGNPPGSNLHDIAIYEVGSTFALNKTQFLTPMINGRESTVTGGTAPLDAILAWDYLWKPGTGIQLYVDKGLSNGSPDVGVGVGVHARF